MENTAINTFSNEGKHYSKIEGSSLENLRVTYSHLQLGPLGVYELLKEYRALSLIEQEDIPEEEETEEE